MNTILLQLERLRRHYDVAVRSYDHISLLDLSHSLRIWVELKEALLERAPAFAKTMGFKASSPIRKVLKAARGYPFVFCYLASGVVTYAPTGVLVRSPSRDGEHTDYYVGVSAKFQQDHLLLNNYCYIEAPVDEKLMKALNAESVSRCNYQQWLGAEAVRLCYRAENGSLQTVYMSREIVVKRVANALDGSHASAAAESTNSYDVPVKHLLEHNIGGLPLPYFILLKIAQDILENAPRLLGVGAEDGQPNNSFKPTPLRGAA